jgi:hypothetical protein
METKSYRCKAQWPNHNGSSIIAIYGQNIKKSAATKTTRYIPKGSKHDKICQKKVVLRNFNFNKKNLIITFKKILKTYLSCILNHKTLHWVYCKLNIKFEEFLCKKSG